MILTRLRQHLPNHPLISDVVRELQLIILFQNNHQQITIKERFLVMMSLILGQKKRRKLCNSSNSNSTNINNVVKESSEIKSDDECVNDILKENERLMKQNEELTKKNENIKKKKKKFKKRNQKLMEAIRANRELEMSNKENEMRHHNKMNLYNLQMEEFDVLSLEQLNELELKLHGGLNMIKEARDRLLENKLYCIICLKNAKNMFIQECGHMDICNQCEQNLPSKVCPRCQKAFVNITKVNI
eukprot:655769_1